jgi:hypothetical protein
MNTKSILTIAVAAATIALGSLAGTGEASAHKGGYHGHGGRHGHFHRPSHGGHGWHRPRPIYRPIYKQPGCRTVLRPPPLRPTVVCY